MSHVEEALCHMLNRGERVGEIQGESLVSLLEVVKSFNVSNCYLITNSADFSDQIPVK